MTARFIVGDTLTVLRSMPDASVDLVLTSPPFLALRSYLPADHPDKALEMGSEATPGEYLDALLDVVEECRRVLAPHGSLCFELGDTYSGSGGAGGDYGPDGLRVGQPVFEGSAAKHRSVPKSMSAVATAEASPPPRLRTRRQLAGWPLDKSLCLIPESFRWALVYGRNPFTGRPTPPWRARNVVRWWRPNPPVGDLGDKFRPATSDMVVACTDRKRWFDLDAVREQTGNDRDDRGVTTGRVKDKQNGGGSSHGVMRHVVGQNPAGAPPLDTWKIPTQPYKGSHYATWPEELCRRPILAMCPQKVCTTCGEPSRRIVGEATYVKSNGDEHEGDEAWRHGRGGDVRGMGSTSPTSLTKLAPTLGWTDCGHNTWRRGIVLDPFAGSGTTLAVAESAGRDSIGIDLDERNALLAEQRVGMFLTVEQPA